MDNHFYKILDIFKKLDETNQFAGQAVGQKPGDQWRGTDAGTPGNKLVGAAEGIEPTDVDNEKGSWRHEGDWVKSQGKDPRGSVTHASDQAQRTTVSLADKLKAQWEKTKKEKGLGEAGANNTAPGTGAQPGAIDPKELAVAQQNINKLKSAGVPIPNVQQAAKTVMKDPTDPATPMSAQDKQVDQNLGLAMSNLIANGDPSQVGQLANIIKKAQQGTA